MAWQKSPPDEPTETMLARGMQILARQPSGPLETVAHDLWQAMYDEWQADEIAAGRYRRAPIVSSREH